MHKSVIYFALLTQAMVMVKGIKNKNPSYAVLPLVFIKTDQGLEPPTDIKASTISNDRIHFTKSKFLDEVFFCPTSRKRKQDKLEEANLLLNLSDPIYGISKNCLIAKSRITRAMNMKMPTCDSEPEPVIIGVTERDISGSVPNSVNTQDNIKHYIFGYQLCVENSKREKITSLSKRTQQSQPFKEVISFDIFNFWYNTQSKVILYTKHTIRSERLLFNKGLLQNDQQVEYEDDTDDYNNIFQNDLVTLKETFNQIEATSSYKTQKLIPADDFVFALWRKPTFHYTNINLMHAELQEIWKSLHDKIRHHVKWNKRKFDIYTGVFNIPESSADSVQTILNFKIPQIWVKIIHLEHKITDLNEVTKQNSQTKRKSAVALIANNYLNDDLAKIIIDNYCPQNLCTNFISSTNPKLIQHVRCCHLNENLLRLFDMILPYDDVFLIRSFIEKQES